MLTAARAPMGDPSLLPVNELSFGLAPKIVGELFGTLREVNRLGTSVLIVEQFVHLMLKHTSRAYFLAKGEVALEGKSEELAVSPEVMAAYLGDAGKKAGVERRSPESDGRAPAGTSCIYKGGVR